MVEVLDENNCLQFRELSRRFALDVLDLKTKEYLLEHIQNISKQKQFLELDVSDISDLLASDDLNVRNEQNVYDLLIDWTNGNLKKRKKHFPALFKHVRLQLVPTKYVAEVIRKQNLVREFNDCRDAVEDAFYFLVSPQSFIAQNQRHSYEKGKLMIVGQNEIYAFTENTWSKLTAIYLNYQEWIIATDKQRMFICGGLQYALNYQPQSRFNAYNQVIKFDGSSVSNISQMTVNRAGAMGCIIEKKLLIFGGRSQNVPSTLLNSIEEYSGSSFMNKGNLLQCRSHGSIQVVKKEVYLFGGYTSNQHQNYNYNYGYNFREPSAASCEIYNVHSNSSSNGPNMNFQRAEFGSALLNSIIYVVGGVHQNSNVSGMEFLDTLENNVWTVIQLSGLKQYITGRNSACSLNNEIYILIEQNLYQYNKDTFTVTNHFQNPPINGKIVTFIEDK